MAIAQLPPLSGLPPGIREDYVDCRSTVGLVFHFLEAKPSGSENNAPLVLLLHGFPELAFSWRKIMPRLAAAGNRVVAVDQRGYGRTTGWEDKAKSFEETEMRSFSMFALVRDIVAFVDAIGHSTVRMLVGHDFGAVSAAHCALMRPDVFESLVLMSHPYKGPQSLASVAAGKDPGHIQQDLAQLKRPRKHYKWYNSTPPAASDWENPPQGLHKYLRGYVHLKSANWPHNQPHKLSAWTAEDLEKMPTYYIMPLESTFPETVAEAMEGENFDATKTWLPDEDLDTYVQEWSRTGFQGALNWYRSGNDSLNAKELLAFAGRKIEVPTKFVSGEQDWGNYQEPGALEAMPAACRDFRGIQLIENAGHWPQQENSSDVATAILEFLHETK